MISGGVATREPKFGYPHVASRPKKKSFKKTGQPEEKIIRRAPHAPFAGRKAFERLLLCANTLTSIFTIAATVFFGRLASAAGHGALIAPNFVHTFDRFVIIMLENTVYYPFRLRNLT